MEWTIRSTSQASCPTWTARAGTEGFLAAGLVWLFVTQGRMAAALLLLLQAGLFAEKAFGLIWLAFQTKFLVDSEQLGLMRYVGTASLLMHVVAIFFLVRFILNAQPSPSPAAAVVD